MFNAFFAWSLIIHMIRGFIIHFKCKLQIVVQEGYFTWNYNMLLWSTVLFRVTPSLLELHPTIDLENY